MICRPFFKRFAAGAFGFFLAAASGERAMAATYTVTNTTDGGTGSLRQAIINANATAGTHTIAFDIPGAGPHVISSTSTLPQITRNGVTLDGLTQAGAVCGTVNAGVPHQLKVELRAGHTLAGIRVSADDVSIRGLSITNHQGAAIITDPGADRATIMCNNVGVRPDNTTLDANGTGTSANVAVFVQGTDSFISSNVISGNTNISYALLLENHTGSTVSGNLIGLKPDGTTVAGNDGYGVTLLNADDAVIGGPSSIDRNVIGANTDFGIVLLNANRVDILGNYIGTTTSGTAARPNGIVNMVVQDATDLEIGEAGAGNVIAGANTGAMVLQGTVDAVMLANSIGIGADGTSDIGNTGYGVGIFNGSTAIFGDTTASGANTIAHSGGAGIIANSSGSVALLANIIKFNDGPGIDLGMDGITPNDAGDVDTGPNDLLNFPVLVDIGAKGTTTLAYDLTLDAPANPDGYRIDFFKNTVSDSHGEGELHLGAVNIGHSGGFLSFSGNFIANAPVSPGDLISAVATRATSGTTYDITSEFSATVAATASTDPLVVTTTADDGPGSLRAAITHANATPGDDAITFAIPGAGPHVIMTGSNLPIISDDSVSIDASTQGGAICAMPNQGVPHDLRVELRRMAGSNTGLRVTGDGVTVRGLSITGYPRQAVHVRTASDNFTLDCSYVGVRPDGITLDPNAFNNSYDAAVLVEGTNATLSRNVISGNDDDAEDKGLLLSGATDASLSGNVVGLLPDGSSTAGNGGTGIEIQNSTDVHIGDGTPTGRNIISSNAVHGINLAGTTAIVSGNYIGVASDGTTARGNSQVGILAGTGSVALVEDNVIAHSVANDGIEIATASTKLAIVGNAIHSNAEEGIDLDTGGSEEGVTPNDPGDGDTGANELLNFPVINTIEADGTVDITFDINLDVPSNPTHGYRIDFFKNTAVDASGHGEGEVHLGFVTVAHSGGNLRFTDTLTANASVFPGDIISATATRATSGTTYDITSEFSTSVAATAYPDPLVVTSAADTNTRGTLRYAISHANANAGDDVITFDIPGMGPHTIALGSALPTLADDGISIDATTQAGASCGDLWSGVPHTLMVDLEWPGQSFDTNKQIVSVTGTNVTISGLTFSDSNARAIKVSGASMTLRCSYVGVNPDGTYGAIGNTRPVWVYGANPLIGGLGPGDGNVIVDYNAVVSDNGVTNMRVQGNFIGVDPTGTADMGTCGRGVSHVGGSMTWGDITGNLISGCTNGGIVFDAGKTFGGVGGADILIRGNHLGTDRTGTAPIPNGNGITMDAGDGITVGGTAAADGNAISGNVGSGIQINDAANVTVLNNRIGLNATGTAALGNGQFGILANNIASLTVGDGTAAGRNVIAGNGHRPIETNNAGNAITINGNYIGTDTTGNTPLANGTAVGGGEDDGIVIRSTGTGIAIVNNVVGGFRGEPIKFWGNATGSAITIRGNSVGVGTDGTSNIDTGIGIFGGITFGGTYSASDVTIGGLGPGDGNLIANQNGHGIAVVANAGAFSGIIRSNTIRDNGLNGIEIGLPVATAVILSNSIHSNGSLGIDLGGDGVTANDGGDGDTGANDLLNHPVIDQFIADGSAAVSYTATLDLPMTAYGYRVEFFRNSAPDAANGEGETFLGAVDLAGPGTYTGSFTSVVTVGPGQSISATATRKTSANTYDITSEFSVNATSFTANPAELVASKAVAVIDDGLVNGNDTVAIPGATLRYTIVIHNDGAGAADADNTVIVDEIPAIGALKVSDFGGTPGAGPVRVSDGSPASGLSYTYSGLASGTDDIAFSNDGAATWNYSPVDAVDSIDPSVTHIRLNPTGTFNANSGTPPSLTVQYDIILF